MTWPTSFTLHARLKLDSGVNGQSSGVMSKAAVKEEMERNTERERNRERERAEEFAGHAKTTIKM